MESGAEWCHGGNGKIQTQAQNSIHLKGIAGAENGRSGMMTSRTKVNRHVRSDSMYIKGYYNTGGVIWVVVAVRGRSQWSEVVIMGRIMHWDS